MSDAKPQPDAPPQPAADPAAVPPMPPSARAVPLGGDAAAEDPRLAELRLTDFIDLETLQEIQDLFASLTRLGTSFVDDRGEPITLSTDPAQHDAGNELLELLLTYGDEASLASSPDTPERFVAPIVVEGRRLGAMTVDQQPDEDERRRQRAEWDALADKLGLDDAGREALIAHMRRTAIPVRAVGVQFLHVLAQSITRLCYEDYIARQRLEDLEVLFTVARELAGRRDLRAILDAAAKGAADALKVKAATIRLLEGEGVERELALRSRYGLSDGFFAKGAIRPVSAELFSEALERGYSYCENMQTDPRVVYPHAAQAEGIVSMACIGLKFADEPIGTLQLFDDKVRRFSSADRRLLEAIGQLLATAIETSRLAGQRAENQRLMRQLQLGADVQRRLLPQRMPEIAGYDIAARYIPSFELAGDFYDFLPLSNSLGIAMGDVVGKGVAASLLMAGARAYLRAFAQDVYDLDEIMQRVNVTMTRDTNDREFVTLWYGVIDLKTDRLTYCNAGQDPPLLLREGELIPLDIGGMVVGIHEDQHYDKSIIDLEPGDTLLLYSDGLPDAMDAQGHRFGRERIERTLREAVDPDRPKRQHTGPVTSSEVVRHIIWRMREFTQRRRNTDDTTLVVLRKLDET